MGVENSEKQSLWSKWKKPVEKAVKIAAVGAVLAGGAENMRLETQAHPKQFREITPHEFQYSKRNLTIGGEYIAGITTAESRQTATDENGTTSEVEDQLTETILTYDPYTGEASLLYDDGNPEEGPKLIETYLFDLLDPDNRELLPNDPQIDQALDTLKNKLPDIEKNAQDTIAARGGLDQLKKEHLTNEQFFADLGLGKNSSEPAPEAAPAPGNQ